MAQTVGTITARSSERISGRHNVSGRTKAVEDNAKEQDAAAGKGEQVMFKWTIHLVTLFALIFVLLGAIALIKSLQHDDSHQLQHQKQDLERRVCQQGFDHAKTPVDSLEVAQRIVSNFDPIRTCFDYMRPTWEFEKP